MKLSASLGLSMLVLLTTSCLAPDRRPTNQLSFFIASAGSGDGANLGGLGIALVL